MSYFLLSPAALRAAIPDAAAYAFPRLAVSDYRYDHDLDSGDGLWVPVFLEFLEARVAELGLWRRFRFSCNERIDDELLEEVDDPFLRQALIAFVNRHYESWKEDCLEVPDYERLRDGCRGYCETCECAFREIFGTYDGPREEDVEDDEDADDPDADEAERERRAEDNRARAEERTRRREAQEEAEAEVVDHEWACEEDCDGFLDHVYEAYRESFHADTEPLDRWFEALIREFRYGDFPALHA